MPSYVSIEQGAERLGVSTRTIRRMIAAGELRAYRLGGRLIRIDEQSLRAVLRPIPAAVSR
ncbi:MAG: helix-turn-helix domain-containing protein [Actinomycetales bacterium]|nr:helix-turn-helix domain-containing protein [Actinomycetales bacterium]